MKLISKYNEFVNEAKSKNVDFNKVVKILQKSKYPLTIVYSKKWDDIDIIVGMDAPNKIIKEIHTLLSKENINMYQKTPSINIVGDSNILNNYDDIKEINGGYKNY